MNTVNVISSTVSDQTPKQRVKQSILQRMPFTSPCVELKWLSAQLFIHTRVRENIAGGGTLCPCCTSVLYIACGKRCQVRRLAKDTQHWARTSSNSSSRLASPSLVYNTVWRYSFTIHDKETVHVNHCLLHTVYTNKHQRKPPALQAVWRPLPPWVHSAHGTLFSPTIRVPHTLDALKNHSRMELYHVHTWLLWNNTY